MALQPDSTPLFFVSHNTFLVLRLLTPKTVNLLILKAGLCAIRLPTTTQSSSIGY